ALRVQAHWVLGLSLQFIGDLLGSREHLEQSLVLYDHSRHAPHVFLYGSILNRMHLGRALTYLGYPDQGHALAMGGLRGADKFRHPLGLCNALSVAVSIEAFHRNTQSVTEMSERMLLLADEHGLPYYAAIGTIMRGWAHAIDGDVEEGCTQIRAGLAAQRSVETEQQRAYYLVLMAEAMCAVGRVEDGLQVVEEAFEAVDRTDEHCCEAELYRIQGELLTQSQRWNAAEGALHRAFDIARTQQAKALELRVATSLPRLSGAQGRADAARPILAQLYESFTEGFATPDLQAARSLLRQFE